MNNQPIGIFDSGSGGLTVARQVLTQLPAESIIYVADTARVPYGSKTAEEILLFNKQIISFLLARQVKMIVMGCNTSSALALDWDRQNFSLPIVGLIEPAARQAAQKSRSGKIGVLATPATVASRSYSQALRRQNPRLSVSEIACPRFVPLIESGRTAGPEVEKAARNYLRPLLKAGCDTIIYGCTHYPLLAPVFGRLTGPEITWIDPAVSAVREAGKTLQKKDLLSTSPKPRQEYFITGPAETFDKIAAFLLGRHFQRSRPLPPSELEKFPAAQPRQ